MKTSRIAAAVLVVFLLPSSPRPAAAQDDPVTVQARARFKEGVDAYDKGQYENARLAFLQAYALKKHPAVLLNLAQSSAKSNHALEAAKYFQQFLRESPSATPQQRLDAENGLAEVRQKLGRIEISGPAGTEVTLDEKDRLGVTPFSEPFDVEPGSHTLRGANETLRVTANAGQKVPARFGSGVSPVVPVAPVAPVSSNIAEPNIGYDPPAGGDAGAKHTNLFSPPATMLPVYLGLAVAGLGGASTVLFAIFRGDAQDKSDSVAREIRSKAIADGYDGNGDGIADASGVCSTTDPRFQSRYALACSTLIDNNNKVDTNNAIAIVSASVAGAGLLFAAGWYLFAPKRDDATSGKLEPKPAATPILTPYAGTNNAGFTLSGSF